MSCVRSHGASPLLQPTGRARDSQWSASYESRSVAERPYHGLLLGASAFGEDGRRQRVPRGEQQWCAFPVYRQERPIDATLAAPMYWRTTLCHMFEQLATLHTVCVDSMEMSGCVAGSGVPGAPRPPAAAHVTAAVCQRALLCFIFVWACLVAPRCTVFVPGTTADTPQRS